MAKLLCQILLGVLLIATPAMPVDAAEHQSDLLRSRALGYLQLLDQGLYPQAWQEMTPIFQILEQQEQWQNRQQLVRATYGATIKRAFYAMDFRDHFLLSPDGQYVVVQFQTSFQFKASTRETVVLDCSAAPACSIREYIIH